MLDKSLKFLSERLNEHLRYKYQTKEGCVVLNSILDQGGSVPEANRNKLILSLISLEHESVTNKTSYGFSSMDQYSRTAPPLNFNLNIMISALYNDYEEGLKFLSEAILFFQSNTLFNNQNSPGLAKEIFQLSLEVVKLSYSETYNLWASLGAKYIPSVPFKVRMISFSSDQVEQIIPEVTSTGVEGHLN